MNHTTVTPENDGDSNEAPKSMSVANPRRTRVGADGRPIKIVGPVTTTGD